MYLNAKSLSKPIMIVMGLAAVALVLSYIALALSAAINHVTYGAYERSQSVLPSDEGGRNKRHWQSGNPNSVAHGHLEVGTNSGFGGESPASNPPSSGFGGGEGHGGSGYPSDGFGGGIPTGGFGGSDHIGLPSSGFGGNSQSDGFGGNSGSTAGFGGSDVPTGGFGGFYSTRNGGYRRSYESYRRKRLVPNLGTSN